MRSIQSRIYKLLLFFSLLGCLLIAKLVYLQLIDGQELAMAALNNRIQELPIGLARGDILDRNKIPITNTAQKYSVIAFPSIISSIADTATTLAQITKISEYKIDEKLRKMNAPFVLLYDIDFSTAQKINDAKIAGIVAVTEKIRYGNKSLATHVTGYVNTIDNKGVSGIEAMYDDLLRGDRPQYVAALVDAGQNIIPGLGYKCLNANNIGPSDIVLTIDNRIQQIVEKAMDQHIEKGAVIIMRPLTGEILAMASRPNFDASRLSDYLKHDSAPLLNRAVSAFQPGSVFKLVVAAAAIEENVVKLNDMFYDPGYIDVNNLRFKGWDYEKGGRGTISFAQAMAYSSNPVFIDVGLRLGAEKLLAYADKLGFGHKTGLNFIGEAEGNLPDLNYTYSGELANFAIGQGKFEATPIQMACLVSTIVNDGIKVNPYLVSGITAINGNVINNHVVAPGERVLSVQTARKLRDMMTAVTTYGTGQAANIPKVGSAGKTGSAETGRKNIKGESINHAWFAGYAPAASPQYVAVVFIEEGMSGGDVAAPIFSEIMSKIITDDKH